MKETILMSVCKWVFKQFNFEENIEEISNDVLKSCLWSPLKNKLIQFFSSKKESEAFIDKIAQQPATNNAEPYRDIEDIYEEITGNNTAQELWLQMIECLKENSEQLKKACDLYTNMNSSQFYIGNQFNNGDVTNIGHDQIIYK